MYEKEASRQQIIRSCAGRGTFPAPTAQRSNTEAQEANQQVRRTSGLLAGLIIIATLLCIPYAHAETDDAHTDLEFRIGADYVCGICGHKTRRLRAAGQLFIDRLYPLTKVGPGVFELGFYGKGALLDGGQVPQIAGGILLGYRFNMYELFIQAGRAYATDRIGATKYPNSGQTRQTYDLGLTLRRDFERYYISVSWQHNSNGESLGINFCCGSGRNPGFDSVLLGGGIRF